jgi:hypothetical protein
MPTHWQLYKRLLPHLKIKLAKRTAEIARIALEQAVNTGILAQPQTQLQNLQMLKALLVPLKQQQ